MTKSTANVMTYYSTFHIISSHINSRSTTDMHSITLYKMISTNTEVESCM